MNRTHEDVLINPVDKETFFKQVRERLMPAYLKEAEKIRFLADKMPEWKAQVIKSADEAVEHRFVLPSTQGEPYFVGDPPKWYENPLSDNEFVWTLNRHYHFQKLAQAYHMTSDKKYAESAVNDLLDWIESCPVPQLADEWRSAKERFDAPTPWRLLDTGIRMAYSWSTLLIDLIGTEFFTADVMERFAVSVYEQELVLRCVSPILRPNADHNHFMHEMFGLLSASVMMPELKCSQENRDFAAHEISRCMKNMFTADGSLIEATPHYHDICLRMALECASLAKKNGISLPQEFYDTVKKAAVYSAFDIKPNGLRAALGDSDYIANCMPKIIALHYGVFGSLGIYENIVGILSEEQLAQCLIEYMFEYGGLAEFEQALNSAKPGASAAWHYDKSISEVFYRTGWSKFDTYFMFACLSPVPDAHCHIDVMTFDLYMGGVSAVADPGRHTYADTDMRRIFKSPDYHACLLVGEKPPFEYINNWSYGPQKDGYISKIYEGELFGADAVHYNYEPAVHKRLVFTPDKDVFVVYDKVFDPEKEQIDIYFPTGSTDVEADSQKACARIDGKVMMSCSRPLELQILDGFCAPVSDALVPIKRVRLTDRAPGSENTGYLTVFSAKGMAQELSVTDDGEYDLISFSIGGKEYRFRYRFGESLDRA